MVGVACTPAPYTGGAQPVPSNPPATATSVPATPTSVPATATALPPTATLVRPSPTATPRPRPSVSGAINNALADHAGTIGVFYRSLMTGETVSVNPDRRFTSASLYKLFVLETAEAAIEDGALDPNETLTMTAAAAAGDPYFDYLLGTRVSVDCALQTMIEMSGNGAADVLLHRLGSAAINTRARADGLNNSGITADGAYTSPADVATLLESVARGKDVDQAASQRMLDLLSNQQQDDRLPAPLPLDVRIAHKTGELPDLRHDAGIIFAPSGTYILAVLVEDAPSESAARSTIVDISRAVYDAVEPAGLPSYLGLAPRIAEQVFRLPDSDGRLAMLGDPRTETGTLSPEVERAADAASDVRLRPEVFGDLISMQGAAAQANVPFWVRSGFEQPTDAESAHTLPTEWILPCAVEQPQRTPDRAVSADAVAGAQANQVWLGTVLTVTDQQSGPPSSSDDVTAPAWRWLQQHAAEFGFAPTPPDSTPGSPTHVPWSLRWVGRQMATRLQPFNSQDYPARATSILQQAETELTAQDPRSHRPPLWGLADACWTIATNSGQGCPCRWYFLELPLS